MSVPGGPSPPAYYASSRDDQLMAQFRALAQRYEINDHFASKLKQLEGFEIVLILDDSGSMNTPLRDQGNAGPFTRSVTRWDELKTTASIIADIASVFDKDGLDVYFLNRATMHQVTSSQQLGMVFASPPTGMTPITPVLQHVLNEKQNVMVERKLLIIIATDGAPTNQAGQIDTESLRRVLMARNSERCHVTFLACTDDDQTMEYLNKWDTDIHHLDVVDDYHSERAEVLKAQGPQFRFSFGDYIVKCLLGSIDPEFDALDEVKSCCTVQ